MNKAKGCGCVCMAAIPAFFIAAGFVLTREGVQTDLANSMLAEKFPGSSVKRVRIVPGSASVGGLDLKLGDGRSLKLESLDGDFSTGALLAKSIEIGNLSARGIEFDMAEAPYSAQPAESARPGPDAAPAPRPGADAPKAAPKGKAETAPFEFPDWSVSIAKAEADMRVTLPDSSTIESSLSLKSFSSEKIAYVKTMDLDLENRVRMAGLKGENVALKATMVRTNGASSLKLAVERDGRKLAQVSGRIDAGYRQIDAQTQINAETADIENIIKDAPDFKAHAFAETKISAAPFSLKTKLSARLDAQNLKNFYGHAAKNPNFKFIHAHLPFLEPIDDVALSSEVAAELSDGELSIANCDIVLSANGSRILQVKNASAFKLDPENISRIPDGELLEIAVPALPSKIVNAFLGEKIQLAGSDISAKFSFSKKGNEFLFGTIAPLSAPGLRLEVDGKSAVSGISPTLELNGGYAPAKARLSAKLAANPAAGGKLDAALDAELSGKDIAANLTLNGEPQAIFPELPLPKGMTLAANVKAGVSGGNLEAEANARASAPSGAALTAEISAATEGKNAKAKVKLGGDIAAVVADKSVPKTLKLAANADLLLDGDVAALENFKLQLVDDGAGTLLAASQTSQISYDIKKGEASFSGKIFEAESKNVPFAILKPFLGDVDARDFSLKLAASADKGGTLAVQAEAGLAGLAVLNGGNYALKDLDISLEAEAEAAPGFKSVSAKVPSLKVAQGGTALAVADMAATASLADGKLALKAASLNATGSIPKILSQPALEKFDNASNGSFEASAALKGDDLSATVTVQNVSPKSSTEATGKILLAAKAKLKDLVPQTISASLDSESAAGKSGVTAEADLAEDIRIILKAASITTDDFETLAAALTNPVFKDGEMRPESPDDGNGKKRILRPASLPGMGDAKPSAPSGKTPAPEKDLKALWDFGKNLALSAEISEISRRGESLAKNLKGSLSVTPTEASVPSLEGEVFGAALDFSGRLAFTEERMYSLGGANASLKGLHVDKFMQPNSAGQKMFVGAFDISANLRGENASLKDLPQTLTGRASALSNGGVMHIMDRGSNIGAAAEVGSAVLKIGGSLLGNRVKELGAIGDLVGLLSEMNYSRISAEMERGEDLDIVLKGAEVRADRLMLRTAGVLKYNPELPFARQAIYFPVKVYAKKGRIEDLFSKIGLATGTGSDGEYADGPTFIINGTLSKPENNLFEIISNAAAQKTLGDTPQQAGARQPEQKPTLESAIGGLLRGIEKRNGSNEKSDDKKNP